MEESLYLEWVQQYFRGLSLGTVETLNGITGPQAYLHTRELRPVFSVTGKWESTTFSNRAVMADVVAMDSELPVKKRPSMGKATGEIPKIGMHKQLNENELTQLDTLVAIGQQEAAVEMFFNDTPAVITGIYERNEYTYQFGLSTGIALVTDSDNTGTAVRLNFGYPDENKFGVAALWTNTASKPFDDIKKVLNKAKADGRVITRVRLDSDTLENIANTTQAKELFAFQSNFVGGNIPTPDTDQLNSMVNRRYGFTFEVMDRTCIVEKNGEDTPVKPWKAGNVIFLTGNGFIGDLVYARLAEQNRQTVSKATYIQPTPYILISKYHKLDPSFSEHTKSQARVFPVINNVNSIYLLESTVIEA
ncbi:hypothetical protein [Adhaeribacter aquaticus]|uniref:major capsid protein n=1 Tax=Adhaeribacter aquaticus TaxID=299567 RepID=UPI0003F5908C|nr:hypothetical protein [Adhaeribacter aquaticus]